MAKNHKFLNTFDKKHYSAKLSARKHRAVLHACPTLLQDSHVDPRLCSTMPRVKGVTTRMHIARDCVMHNVMSSSITPCQHFIAYCRDSQEASLPVY